MDFKFSDVSENADSLIISGIDKSSNVRSFPNKQAFVKGDIKVVERDDRSIEYILVQEFIRKRGDVYYPKSPFEIVHNRPVVGIASYFFYPKNKMPASKISNNGIFKKAHVK
ncbi:hypothetical protein IM792_05795 [Mucilaginibacter sp. JRF]|uniref:hypothetical protein n=1 Tax=Mucilaginibacter sp. JRF TaxID=2780088 RepID=UPI001881927F|nr:hypothetical protein [Mucilaginibacter sp. JRF]MBE9583954.1 hypothetical protein [Mucilaginibacter sp. JRF]